MDPRANGSRLVLAVLVALVLSIWTGAARAAWPGSNGHIAFVSDIPILCCNIVYTVNPDGTGLQEVFSDPTQNLSIDEYSPDGSTLLVNRSSAGSCPGGASIWVLRDNGSQQHEQDLALLDDPAGPDDNPAVGCPSDTRGVYSMDGTRIAFGRSGSHDSDRNGVWIMNADGSHKLRVASPTNPTDVRWSYDMTQLSYQDGGTIYVVGADGSTESPVPSFSAFPLSPGATSDFSFVSPTGDSPSTLSPDGAMKVFLHCCYADTGSVPQVNVANSDGTNVQRITNFDACPGEFCGTVGGDISQATWQPVPVEDSTPPVITGSLSGTSGVGGWFRSTVTLTWMTGDPESGIFFRQGCEVSAVSTETAGTSFSCFAINHARLSTRASVTIKIDETSPIVAYSGNAGNYTVDQTVDITCSASDGLSGLASTTCRDITEPAYLLGLGNQTFSATATDNAGNNGSGSTTLTVSVTSSSLCNLTEEFVQSSLRYQNLSSARRTAVDRLAAVACHYSESIFPKLKPSHKALLLSAYESAVEWLARQGWLTRDQVAVLERFAIALQ